MPFLAGTGEDTFLGGVGLDLFSGCLTSFVPVSVVPLASSFFSSFSGFSLSGSLIVATLSFISDEGGGVTSSDFTSPLDLVSSFESADGSDDSLFASSFFSVSGFEASFLSTSFAFFSTVLSSTLLTSLFSLFNSFTVSVSAALAVGCDSEDSVTLVSTSEVVSTSAPDSVEAVVAVAAATGDVDDGPM